MNRLCAFLLIALFPLVGGCRQPANTYQQAAIRWVDGAACFSVADTEESWKTPPTIGAISVSQYINDAWIELWGWTTPLSPPTTLGPNQCIPYGHSPSAETGRAAVPTLVPGARYGVEINAQIPNPRAGGDRMVSRRYSRQFCLWPTEGRVSPLVEVPRVRGELRWEVCGQPVAGEPGSE